MSNMDKKEALTLQHGHTECPRNTADSQASRKSPLHLPPHSSQSWSPHTHTSFCKKKCTCTVVSILVELAGLIECSIA